MFEDFSFSSPSSRPGRLAVDIDDRLLVDCDSNLISPLSSRCPSPQSHRFRTLSRPRSSYFRSQQPPPTSVPFQYEQKRLSISTLTQKLHEHTLQAPSNDSLDQGRLRHNGARLSGRYSGYVLTPPDTDHDEDGRCDSSPSLCSNPSPTSIPPDFLVLDRTETPNQMAPEIPNHFDVRLQRQQISQLQCNEGDIDAVRRTVVGDSSYNLDMLPDDCHPSSLPPRSSPRRRALTLHRSRFGPADSSAAEVRGRRRSSSGALQSHRIEKSHYTSHVGRGDHHGLRRKSVVSAALASVVEQP